MKGKIAAIFVLTLLIAPILNAAANEIEEKNLNQAPSTPIIEGPNDGEIGEVFTYTVTSTDPQQDNLYYEFRYSDDPSVIIRDGTFKSGEKVTFSHCWDDYYQESGPFIIKVRAIDENDHEGDWGKFEVKITNAKSGVVDINKANSDLLIKTLIFKFLEKLFERFPILERGLIFLFVVDDTIM